jgi:hypothetical protein
MMMLQLNLISGTFDLSLTCVFKKKNRFLHAQFKTNFQNECSKQTVFDSNAFAFAFAYQDRVEHLRPLAQKPWGENKTGSFLSAAFRVCLSRACLGKTMMHFHLFLWKVGQTQDRFFFFLVKLPAAEGAPRGPSGLAEAEPPVPKRPCTTLQKYLWTKKQNKRKNE